jgi:ubiquitin C-terminal hydrolase
MKDIIQDIEKQMLKKKSEENSLNHSSDNFHKIEKIGLLNNDNTCYMNSVLQCLLHISKLSDYLENNYTSLNNSFKVLSEYINIIKNTKNPKYWGSFLFQNGEKKYYISKSGLKYAIGKINDQYNSNKMNDCAEFLGNFLSIIEKEILGMNIKNIIKDLFNIEIETQTKCGKCHKIIDIEEEKYFYINLPVLSKITKQKLECLDDCIKEYQKKSDFNDYCDNCGNNQQYEEIKIKNTPNILIFNLKRIVKGEHYSHKIDFKDNLNFNSSNYSLFGMIVHYGDQYVGHKVALCKDKSKKWTLFDDEETIENVDHFHDYFYQNVFMLFFEKNY